MLEPGGRRTVELQVLSPGVDQYNSRLTQLGMHKHTPYRHGARIVALFVGESAVDRSDDVTHYRKHSIGWVPHLDKISFKDSAALWLW